MMRKLLLVFVIVMGALLLVTAPAAAQDNTTTVVTIIAQAQDALANGDLATAQALSSAASTLITDQMVDECAAWAQVGILLDQIAQTDSVATADALLTTALTLIDTCGVSVPGGTDPDPGVEPTPAVPAPSGPVAEGLAFLGVDFASGTVVAEPDSYTIDLSDRDNTITRQRINPTDHRQRLRDGRRGHLGAGQRRGRMRRLLPLPGLGQHR